ncbi:Acetylornithine deacetylase/Succinyl-diaminopimelate desuccinylase and related deacylases [Olavius algarvensis Delta 1 endosymbiont]|nr:Acetylornithine deacetylase/Succinyl-diaminopimelate desuccinylase and related deacylases [Olavius algarvensis Delta 1 endosymbiont]
MTRAPAKQPLPVSVSKEVRQTVGNNLDDYLEIIETMVNIDSGADDPAGILAVQEFLAQALEDVGTRIQWRRTDDITHFKAGLTGDGGPVVLLGHADTVFNKGTTRRRPFKLKGPRAFGPGVVDMKGGLATALAAVKCLVEKDIARPAIEFIVVGDEEERTSPPPFLDQLADAAACLVLECGRPGGGYVVSRKGGLWAEVEAAGNSAHAGVNPEIGSNAILVLCRELLRIAEFNGAREGLTVVPGQFTGGTATNVVPDRAVAHIDIRSPSESDLDWLIRRIGRFNGSPDSNLTLAAQRRWPPMDADCGRSVAEIYQQIADAMNIAVHPVSTGGMSDGNWFSQANIPTIDGMGPIGGLDHGPDEYMEVNSIPDRAGLLAGTIVALRNWP